MDSRKLGLSCGGLCLGVQSQLTCVAAVPFGTYVLRYLRHGMRGPRVIGEEDIDETEEIHKAFRPDMLVIGSCPFTQLSSCISPPKISKNKHSYRLEDEIKRKK